MRIARKTAFVLLPAIVGLLLLWSMASSTSTDSRNNNYSVDVDLKPSVGVVGGSEMTIAPTERGAEPSPTSDEKAVPVVEPTTQPTPTTTEAPQPAPVSFVPKHPAVAAAYTALQRARDPATPSHTVIPLIITPVFHDADVLVNMLQSLNVPVYQFAFSWNGNDGNARELLDALQEIPIADAIKIKHTPDNAGFSASINFGLGVGLARPAESCRWFFIVNCDVTFPSQTLPALVKKVSEQNLDTLGMLYGPAIDHYAFVVGRRAVEVAGLMDENFYPAYYEDIDWRWRMNLLNFREVITGLPVDHIRSINLKRVDHSYMQMHHRNGGGWTYGNAKWGEVRDNRIHDHVPPSGWRTPFNIAGFPINLWVKDEERLQCIRTGGGGPMHPDGRCWYNGAKVLPSHLPANAVIPEFLKRPGRSSFQ